MNYSLESKHHQYTKMCISGDWKIMWMKNTMNHYKKKQ